MIDIYAKHPPYDDGIISAAEPDAANAEGYRLLDDLIERIGESDEDYVAVAFAIWVGLTRCLAEGGRTAEELARAAAHHATDQMAEGRA